MTTNLKQVDIIIDQRYEPHIVRHKLKSVIVPQKLKGMERYILIKKIKPQEKKQNEEI